MLPLNINARRSCQENTLTHLSVLSNCFDEVETAQTPIRVPVDSRLLGHQ